MVHRIIKQRIRQNSHRGVNETSSMEEMSLQNKYEGNITQRSTDARKNRTKFQP
jgi:hypothetical protein